MYLSMLQAQVELSWMVMGVSWMVVIQEVKLEMVKLVVTCSTTVKLAIVVVTGGRRILTGLQLWRR